MIGYTLAPFAAANTILKYTLKGVCVYTDVYVRICVCAVFIIYLYTQTYICIY